jgi:hypothetical protein
MKKEQDVNKFRNLIPQRITVKVERNKDEKGIWAKILDLPHCYTQTLDVSELPSMITDLVLTHFEVPEKFKKELGQYVPVSATHLKLEEMFRRLITIGEKTEEGKEVKEVFQRIEAVPV